jgi:hypothetical protein
MKGVNAEIHQVFISILLEQINFNAQLIRKIVDQNRVLAEKITNLTK